jgi:hypothetical protein
MPEWMEYRVWCPTCRSVWHVFEQYDTDWSRQSELERWQGICDHKTEGAQPVIQKRHLSATNWA